MLPDASHIGYDMWKRMGRPTPLDMFTKVMSQGHEPKSTRITFDLCKCGQEKFAYTDMCINCTDAAMKRLKLMILR